MAFTKMGNFTFNHAEQPDKSNLPAAETKANLDSRANELKTAFNAAVDLLNATAAGDSGADNVGAAAIDGIEGASVQAQMVGMKGYVDAHLAATLPHNMAHTQSANGYVKLPDGTILQWVESSATSVDTGGSSISVTLPIAFPNAAYRAWAVVSWVSAAYITYVTAVTVTTSTVTVYTGTSANQQVKVSVLATGY
jgi:hypothetical protein